MSPHPPAIDTLDARRALDLLVLDCVRIQAWERSLFVQCGDGWIVEEAWRRAQRSYVCGVDVSHTQVQLAREQREVPGKVEFQIWDGSCLPLPDEQFDRVVLTLGLDPARNPVTLLPEVQRVLRSRGDVYLLHALSWDVELRDALAHGGLADVRGVARSDDQTAVLVHARAARGPVADRLTR